MNEQRRKEIKQRIKEFEEVWNCRESSIKGKTCWNAICKLLDCYFGARKQEKFLSN